MARWEREETNSIPDWFWDAIKRPTTEHRVEVADCDVAYRKWEHSGNAPVLFIHGMSAHSHWWDFIAPLFTDRFEVIAMDLTGMGDSDFRYEYDGTTYAEEVKAVCDDASFSEEAVLVAHSFGARMAVKACNLFPKRFKALVLVDSGLHDPDEELPDYPPLGGGRSKVYPDRQLAESRFRLYPPQPCTNEYVIRHIAKHSVLAVDSGYEWKFDEELPLTMKDVELSEEELEKVEVPTAIIYGENSVSFTKATLDYTSSRLSNLVAVERISDAQHHVFLDQPLDFVEALKRVLSLLA